jgi:hypothetical protein
LRGAFVFSEATLGMDHHENTDWYFEIQGHGRIAVRVRDGDGYGHVDSAVRATATRGPSLNPPSQRRPSAREAQAWLRALLPLSLERSHSGINTFRPKRLRRLIQECLGSAPSRREGRLLS